MIPPVARSRTHAHASTTHAAAATPTPLVVAMAQVAKARDFRGIEVRLLRGLIRLQLLHFRQQQRAR